MKKHSYIITCLVLVISFSVKAQSIKIPFVPEQWFTEGADVKSETYMGKESILLKSGLIFPKDINFLDGIIEVDMSFPRERNFPGIAFRMSDQRNCEYFYVRPHQSGNPDATQYTPIFNRNAGWQLYYGEGYSTAFTYNFNQWHHIKIDVHGKQAEIYIDNMEKPLIKVSELKQDWKEGKIGLISEGTPVHFANLQYTPKQGALPASLPIPSNGTGGVVTKWEVSNVINGKVFDKKYQLTPEIKQLLKWSSQSSEPSGIVNLAKFILPTDTLKTIVARIMINSSVDQVKELSFGFSDYVRIYLNDKVLYSGSDNFMSRDYRFLGTIGFFDRLYLPLKKGINELWFVIGEDFGGWGVKAKFDNMDNIKLD